MRFFLLFMLLLIPASQAAALSESDSTSACFTLQVASFPDPQLADRFVIQLVNAGEHPLCSTVELQGRGYWTRVFVGSFSTIDAARRYGDRLIARGIVREFLVKKTDFNQALTRPRRVTHIGSSPSSDQTNLVVNHPVTRVSSTRDDKKLPSPTANERDAFSMGVPVLPTNAASKPAAGAAAYNRAGIRLPALRTAAVELAPRIDTRLIPRPDPVNLAFRLVVGDVGAFEVAPEAHGGLWITGDTAEALSRLRWIVGQDNVKLIKLDADGRVRLDKRLLAKASGLGAARVGDPLQVADYITSNEGLLLMVQLAEGRSRYRLHVGHQAPTYGKNVEISGSVNLDNNFDSRINPYRKHGKKLDTERPPEGFDSLVGLNPIARWFNISTNSLVPVGEITFHELAEAYAKLELGLDYLDQGSRAGAHAMALARERRLKSQRPGADIVLTAGSNRVLRNEEEIRLFFAEASGGPGQR